MKLKSNKLSLIKLNLIAVALQLLPFQSWASCGPPQCPIQPHRVERRAISRDQCFSQGLYPGDRIEDIYENSFYAHANIHTEDPSVFGGKITYYLKYGICEYDYVLLTADQDLNRTKKFALLHQTPYCRVPPQNDCSQSPKRLCCDCSTGNLSCS